MHYRACDARALRAKVRKGLKQGRATSRPRTLATKGESWELHWEFDCTAPIVVNWTGRKVRGYDGPLPYLVAEFLRCRKCKACDVTRSRYWAGRAVTEYESAERTLMGTFTLSPDEHALLDLRVSKDVPGFHNGTLEERTRLRTSYFGQELTRWLKRVRKAARDRGQPVSGNVRYMLVSEVHDSENTNPWMRHRPHFHVLLHEVISGALILGNTAQAWLDGTDGELVRKKYKSRDGTWKTGIFVTDDAMVRQTWSLGFTKFQVCDDSKSAFYLVKYISKSMMFKIRASLRYGDEEFLHSKNSVHRPIISERSEGSLSIKEKREVLTPT